MIKLRRGLLLLVVALLLLLATNTLAMDSDNYALDWFVVLSGGGGGSAGSDNFGLDLTVGQSVRDLSSSDAYASCLGYWCGIATGYRIGGTQAVYLPIVLRSHGG